MATSLINILVVPNAETTTQISIVVFYPQYFVIKTFAFY